MGQEIGVTPIQMITIYSAIANGGIEIQPRVVHDVFLGDQHDPLPPATGRRVMSDRTAATMRQILAEVVDHGTGRPAQLGGYTAAGKTGTAQKIDADGQYSKSHYVGSFIGFAPASRPVVTILVVIDSPAGAHMGTDVAAPVFRIIAEQTLSYLNVPQDNPSQWPRSLPSKPAKAQKPEDFMGYLRPDGKFPDPDAEKAPPHTALVRVKNSAQASRGRGIAADLMVLGDGPLVAVPDFIGWPTRKIAQECEKLGLELNIAGSGQAVEQNPAAGLKVPSGTSVWVRMAR